jgi:MoaA/NifB/PqqE/SkfB family radical SAM enzyme
MTKKNKKNNTVNSLMVMLTYACQMACDYCKVKNGAESISRKDLFSAVDLLFGSASDSLQLRFFGGEPLLKFDLIKEAIAYSEKLSRKTGKSIKFMVTTNGILLDGKKLKFFKENPVEIMFSMDGAAWSQNRHRFLKGGKEQSFSNIKKNLLSLVNSGVPYFVNMVITPDIVARIPENIEFFRSLGVGRLQITYQAGVFWSAKNIENLLKGIKRSIGPSDGNFLMNFSNDCEPTILSQEIMVDTDGRVYFDGAIFVDEAFPKLRQVYLMGDIASLGKIDHLYRTKRELFDIFYGSCNALQKKIFLNNLELGLKMKEFSEKFGQLFEHSRACYEHPAIIPILRGDFSVQRRVLSGIGIPALYLYVNGPCPNDCIFCSKKTDPFSDLGELSAKIRGNISIKADKLCIIGNDPMMHPQILKIIKEAKKSGFKEIEVMTSGELLADKGLMKKLKSSGVTSFSIPIFSSDAKIHDDIVQKKGSLALAIRAINEAKRSGIRSYIHTNLLKQNIDGMKKLEKFIMDDLKLPFVILPIRPKTSNVPFEKLAPTYEEMFRKLRGIRSLLGFPLCVVGVVQKNFFKSQDDISDSMKLYFLDQKFTKDKKCKSCRYFDQCPGFFDNMDASNFSAIKPFLKK